MRVLIAFGTRPEIIKLGPVWQALKKRDGVTVDAFWTGQHLELADGLLDLFDIKATFKSGRSVMQQPGLASKFGEMTGQIERALQSRRYDWIVVQGDTATATAAAMAGFLCRVPVAHVEAGLRTNDLQSPWPEEFNRRVITVASTLHFAPTACAADNLRKENIPADSIREVGNTVVDALLYTRKRLGPDYRPIEPALAALPADKKLVLATTHRRENIGEPMRNVLRALRTIGNDGDKVVALPVHLNPAVRKQVLDVLGDAPNVHLLPPLQYPDFVHLLSRAWCIVSDSGGVQEEAPTFGLQILITRDTTERPEVVEAGFGRLVASDYDAIVAGVRELTSASAPRLLAKSNPFGAGDAGERIADELIARALTVGVTDMAA
ncbi:UDP-N-acetylglucosamine 2-epimerase (non-hydrolyzing) [Bradyrhizobium diazoefficiens]|nr:UDP-N-acetylglucosamine 2-epimerase (non-hydrolyzing) [Bradyrhizobium diazoefficiens]MBR0774819.1 UDP-N-acetylglucosamine 2-epimerase (non-hydrolyzing) [Bradyrhizobium diazoefficiens]